MQYHRGLCVLICLVTLGIVLGLADFHFLLSILCVLLILSRVSRATISVYFVPCCPVVLSFYFVLSYMFELNKRRWRYKKLFVKLNGIHTMISRSVISCATYRCSANCALITFCKVINGRKFNYIK